MNNFTITVNWDKDDSDFTLHYVDENTPIDLSSLRLPLSLLDALEEIEDIRVLDKYPGAFKEVIIAYVKLQEAVKSQSQNNK